MNEETRSKAEREFLGDYDGGMTVEEFLGHSSRGGGGSFLSGDWKKDGQITVWMHMGHLIYPVWFHNFYKSITIKDREKGGEKSLVVSTRWNCRDYQPELGPKKADKLLRKARFRQDDGAREHAPVLCPFCKLEDWLAIEVRAGRIGFTQPVFKFADAKGEKAVVLHAGGMVGFFNDKAGEEEKSELKREKISLKDAWKEKTTARLNYLVVLVPDDEPEDGPKKFFAAEGLGDKLKTTIRKEMGRRPKNPDLGNPLKHPYPFVFRFDDDKSFDEKYDVDPLEKKPSDEVLAEIGGDKLDLSDELEPGNCRELRTLFEAHALIDMPFDLFFAEAERAGLMEADDRRAKRPETTAGKAEESERFRCDACDSDGLTADRDTTCEACGAHYGLDGKLDRLLCLDCKKPVEMRAEDGEYACGACGAKHVLRMETQNPGNEEEEWIKPVWTKVEAQPAAKRRGRKAAAAKEA